MAYPLPLHNYSTTMNSNTNRIQTERNEMWEIPDPPEGWFSPEETDAQKANQPEEEDEKFVFKNLPIATKRAENLVAEIEDKTGILIPEIYLRITNDTTFHFLLLVNYDSFHAPEMAAAQILAEEFTRGEEGFDIHFAFSVITEFSKRSQESIDKFHLKWVNDPNGAEPPVTVTPKESSEFDLEGNRK